MSHFEEYKRAFKQRELDPQPLQTFYQNTAERTLPGVNDYTIGYDADQLMQYFEDRNMNAEDFEARTKYYFQDQEYATRKEQQYTKFSNADNADLIAYANRYRNHDADKRSRSAGKAARYFRLMNQRMARYRNDQNADSLTKFEHKEEIMSLRLKAMLEAAEMKSKSSTHEKYLKGRARLSCNMILKNQLMYLISNEHDRRLSRKLRNKLDKINYKIIDAQKEVRKSIKSVQETWQITHGINSTTKRQKFAEYRQRNGFIKPYAADALFNLETFQNQAQVQGLEWPCCVVLGDRHGAPLNKAEVKRRDFNQAYRQAVENGDAEAVEEMQKQAIRRFMRMPVPSPKEVADDDLVKYINKHLRTYYELTKLALPYYQKEVTEGSLKNYAQQHPEFMRKLYYVEALNKYIDFALRCDYMIQYKDGRFAMESDPRFMARKKLDGGWERQLAFGQGQDIAMFQGLKRAYRNMNNRLFIPILKARKKRGMIINNLKDMKNKIIIAPKVNKIKRFSLNPGMSEKDYDDEEEINVQEDDLILEINNKPFIKLSDAKNEKTDKKYLKNKERIIENDEEYDEEDEKEDNIIKIKDDNKIIINEKEEDKKEEPKVEVKIEEPKVEEKKEDKQEDKNLIIEEEKKEEKNKINVINEEKVQQKAPEKMILKAPKYEPVEGSQEVLKYIKDYLGVGNHQEYVDFMEKKANPYIYKGESGRTLDRCVGNMIKFVRFDEKHMPATKEDEINHKWNMDFLATWEKGKENPVKMGEMIAQYLPHIYDDIEMPPFPKNADPADMEQTEYRKELDAWCDRLVKTGKVADFLYKASVGKSIDQMKKTIPGLKEYVQKNPKMNATMDILTAGWCYLKEYLINHYHVSANLGSELRPIEIKDAVKVSEQGMKMYAFMLSTNMMKNKAALNMKLGAFDQGQMKFMIPEFEQALKEEQEEALKAKDQEQKEKIEDQKEEQKEKKEDQPKNVIIEEEDKVETEIEISEELLSQANLPKRVREPRAPIPKELKAYSDAANDYKELHDGMNANPVYKQMIKNANYHLVKGLARDSVDRVAMKVMKPVNFDDNWQPITKQDMENHKWNLKFLKTWEGTEGKLEVMGNMLTEQLPKILDDVALPEEPKIRIDLKTASKEEKAQAISSIRKQLDEFCETLVKDHDKYNKLVFLAKQDLSYDNLKKKVPGFLDFFNNNTKFKAKGDTLGYIFQYLSFYLQTKYGYDNAHDMQVKKNMPGSEELLDNFAENYYENYVSYLDHKDDEVVPFDKSGLKTIVPSMEEDREFWNTKKIQPELSRQAYKTYGTLKRFNGSMGGSKYAEQYQKVQAQFAKYAKKGDTSMEKCAYAIMKSVIYDSEGKPIATRFRQNEDWNMKWLKAWETNDAKAQEKMVSQYLPETLDTVKDIPIPTADELKKPNAYLVRLNKWLDDKLEKNTSDLIMTFQKLSSINFISKIFPGAKNYQKNNPKFAQLMKVTASLEEYVYNYVADKYLLDIRSKEPRILLDKDEMITKAKPNLVKIIPGLMKDVTNYGKRKKDQEVPFQIKGKK
ncbi:hypothetical protein [Butyrivibrio sp. AE2032]|uniref:hypothetical protein n=1 Tax=Butyrivibrio sp. AE2032 TaxID=1458463 RepID=UPI000557F2E4|nr:hypothetical protein [Butyrivibrio sp. AE2032]